MKPMTANKETRVDTLERKSYFRSKWQLYAMLVIPLITLFVFSYGPMYGILIAFKDYQVSLGIWGSPWAKHHGMANFLNYFNSYNFGSTLKNTLVISFYQMIVGVPAPIILAISLYYTLNVRFRKIVQTVSYAPYFISTIVFVSIINMMFNTRTGVLGILCERLFHINVLGAPGIFPSLYVWTGIWQGIGFSAIVYIAALTSVDPQLHEAAVIDGATTMQIIRNVDIPSIMPTVAILLILNMGSVLNVGYERIYAMQNPNNLTASEVISTYSYKVGLVSSFPDFSYSAAIGLFQSVVGLLLILVSNKVVDRISGNGFM